MEFSGSKFLGGVALILALATVAGCHRQKNNEHGYAERPRLRVACAAEIQKYCADQPRKRRCLRENSDKLSEECKAAFAQLRGRKGGGGGNGDNE